MESLLANYGSDDEGDEGPQGPPPLRRASFSASLPPPNFSGDGTTPRSSLFASLPCPKFEVKDSRKPDFRALDDAREENDAFHRGASDLSNSNKNDRSTSGLYSKVSVGTRVSNADDEIPKSKRGSLFSALPPPKSTGSSFGPLQSQPLPGFRVLDDTSGENDASHRGVSDLSNNNNKNDRSTSGLYSKVSVGTKVPKSDDDTPKSRRGALFSALPPPKSTGLSVGPLQSQPLPGFPLKRVVQLRPNIDATLLKDLDDDDDIQPQPKRHATDAAGSDKPTGLAAILPKPKNLGSTLGSGYASSQHASLDLETASVPAPQNSAFTTHLVQDPSSFSSELPGNTHEHISGSLMSAPSEPWDGYNVHAEGRVHTHTDAVDPNAAFYQSNHVSHEGAEILCPEGYYEVPDEFSDGTLANETSTVSNAQDPLADLLLKERRKGGKNAPVNIVEVRQTDLTAKKVREDQLRTTGIAFGPAYRPVSSNKDKPSKLHRRKHQIGSLYYDMKQKEMELTERRARGNMTKAVTQGKYGW